MNNTDSSARRGFFTRIDWAAFWTATIASFVVYFLTAAPSITLEDAGELVTAGDHLGVPHPPGYPLWTVCAFLFARVFGFVHYMGQPNPAWAVSIMSGFFAALAAGLTAMLITRSGTDMLDELAPEGDSGDREAAHSRHAILGWVGGVAGSLVFAFSPVEWSQAAIPEVYTLNSFFLMWVFLLSYRWMRRPSDKVLWAVSFIFGLGLTNYQVLVFAIVPLFIIILLRDIALFRDFVLTLIPFAITAGILMLGAEPSKPGFPKLPPFKNMAAGIDYSDLVGPPLAAPSLYAILVILLAAAVGVGIFAGIRRRRSSSGEKLITAIVLGAIGLFVFVVAVSFPSAPPIALPAGYKGPVFSWLMPDIAFWVAMALLWALAWFTPGGRWYAGAVTIVEFALAILLGKGCLLGLTHPQTGWFLFYCGLNFAFLALAWALLPRGRTVAIATLCAEAGVAFYGYMPIASDTHPPMNWGYPRTWTGFKHAISRGQYEKISPTAPFAPIVLEQLGSYFTDLRKQFTLLLVPFGFLPFTLWRLGRGRSESPNVPESDNPEVRESEEGRGAKGLAFVPALAIACLVAGLAAVDRLWNKADAFVPKGVFVGAMGVIFLLVAIGFAIVTLRQLLLLLDAALHRSSDASERIASGVSVAAAAGALLVAIVGLSFSVSAFHFVGPTAVIKDCLVALRPILGTTFLLTGLAVATLVVIGILVRRRGQSLNLAIGETSQQWLISTFACFLVMSFLLIVMAAPKGDLQDNFIQKVKFISSHAIFSLWIGYGLAFGLATFLPRRRTSATSSRRLPLLVGLDAFAVLVGAPLIPIYENFFNDALIEEMSSASQDGHDFGWQFGNYQLRGAEAIAEELSSDEEPLPNPDFPPAMTTNAVFFGGTDPGRFVPTYMIFSADVRPDVFLITQNALADNTYMDTMRDMYGDDIWMPLQKDNSDAFSQYVEDVQSGRKPNYGDISFEGGRVQVTGALAVMEINGIITEQIFRMNRDRHDFYVEESYTMRWMYPYETPHGLIMKIEKEKTPLTAKHVRNDLDFWDWYSRRLLGTPKYHRDFTAKKSFSKLRASIAGLYAASGRHQEAERAFREAVRLYPASPESCLRLVQEILMPYGRFAEALRILQELQSLDPNNKRMPGLVAELQRAEDARVLVERHAGADPAKLGSSEAISLAEAQLVLQRRDAASATLRTLVARASSLSRADVFHVGMLCSSAQMRAEAASLFATFSPDELIAFAEDSPDRFQTLVMSFINGSRLAEANGLLVRYLRTHKDDWRCLLELAIVRYALNRVEDALVALDKANRYAMVSEGDQEAFVQMVRSNPVLTALVQMIHSRTSEQPTLSAPKGRP